MPCQKRRGGRTLLDKSVARAGCDYDFPQCKVRVGVWIGQGDDWLSVVAGFIHKTNQIRDGLLLRSGKGHLEECFSQAPSRLWNHLPRRAEECRKVRPDTVLFQCLGNAGNGVPKIAGQRGGANKAVFLCGIGNVYKQTIAYFFGAYVAGEGTNTVPAECSLGKIIATQFILRLGCVMRLVVCHSR